MRVCLLFVAQFEGNTCASSGGGLFIADTAVVTVLDTVFKDNAAGIDGGGVAVSAQANLTRCTFVGNEATADSGGGLYLAHVRYDLCTVANAWVARAHTHTHGRGIPRPQPSSVKGLPCKASSSPATARHVVAAAASSTHGLCSPPDFDD